MFEAAAQVSMIVVFGLIGMVLVNLALVSYLARRSSKVLEAEVLKANKRLSDQISSRVG